MVQYMRQRITWGDFLGATQTEEGEPEIAITYQDATGKGYATKQSVAYDYGIAQITTTRFRSEPS
jgi:hypothetical protein